ncbi:DNA-binding transcriptional regulator, LacI/PurR family [Nonomuraea maritima]|uniref:DNA-binding transcriptional regulator, LacI/PurR family n=1 Tax=Nonomuraea maritima TaxID=683260 RepID=A0A1G8XXW2_9ACTN|nr:LacI family DNA-binding transcriptional regulator [Nonomuraea maritima]SDJ95429.1 DNA-binding transcriptional regulator, LacI/PurR family [Nonomuraea maritima]
MKAKPRRPAVLTDVAARAGVSTMTVSRALNAPDLVRAETRARVLDAVRELDYRPNQAARQLVTGRSGTLGVVGVDTTLYGPATTLYCIEQAARRAGYSISVASLSSLKRRSVEEGVQRLRTQAADGVIIVAPHESAADGLRHLPPEMPVVAVDAGDDIPVPVVKVDQRAGAAHVTRHLLGLGHETVAHVAGPADWLDADDRIEGWRDVLEDAGRPVPEVLRGDWSPNSGYELGRGLGHAVTAVFVANDQMALGVLRALREAGRRVPEDVSVAGFDDIPESGYFWPPLTTVRQDFGEVGRLALRMLLDRMAGGDPGVRVLVAPELVVRESTGPVRRA